MSNKITKQSFRGVFSCDRISDSLEPFPAGCVVNTDAYGQPGHHWVALYQEKPGVLETFDSYGKNLHFYSPHFDKLFAAYRLISQSHEMQSLDSTVCGQYCIFFLLRRCSSEIYSHIIHLFTENKSSNDAMVCQYVNHYFDLHTEI